MGATRKQKWRRWRSCSNKRKHRNEADAWKHVRDLKKKGGDANASRLSVYRCRYCHNWHVGHRAGKERRRDQRTD